MTGRRRWWRRDANPFVVVVVVVQRRRRVQDQSAHALPGVRGQQPGGALSAAQAAAAAQVRGRGPK